MVVFNFPITQSEKNIPESYQVHNINEENARIMYEYYKKTHLDVAKYCEIHGWMCYCCIIDFDSRRAYFECAPIHLNQAMPFSLGLTSDHLWQSLGVCCVPVYGQNIQLIINSHCSDPGTILPVDSTDMNVEPHTQCLHGTEHNPIYGVKCFAFEYQKRGLPHVYTILVSGEPTSVVRSVQIKIHSNSAQSKKVN
ncbi:uncharacterized protein MELLADRAFT_112435 [Melampsora larici-populina 98AG31]|uniref:Uncharacterized protein n=1 Tax=Melampsora larici-populina (strain 98AG31 / pathotype 3-4-7) TaxID=747676 RepID=F4S6G8_MELLP|nr:uncharacterized protein MELLADRAFT_112435 [Melampsora larici-populina 98AG31]EGF99764.1 hypothetical protein MELLADRAFT_112435 [Melampsora larici-populina 98AG31]